MHLLPNLTLSVLSFPDSDKPLIPIRAQPLYENNTNDNECVICLFLLQSKNTETTFLECLFLDAGKHGNIPI